MDLAISVIICKYYLMSLVNLFNPPTWLSAIRVILLHLPNRLLKETFTDRDFGGKKYFFFWQTFHPLIQLLQKYSMHIKLKLDLFT